MFNIFWLQLPAKTVFYSVLLSIIILTQFFKVGTDVEWVYNGAGYLVSHKFGFGLVDASAAVNASVSHVNFPGMD